MNTKRPLTGIAKLRRYVRLLDRARIALDDARQLYPDVGLDHAVQRLTQQLMDVSYLLPAHREAALRKPVEPKPPVASQTP
jgi:hypothetical protein